MDTFRLNFIDIDQSFNIPVADTSATGYMVCRAPKGRTEAMYFPRGQTTQIHSMLGAPTAHWPDLQDAIDFNNQFGLWISAPAGSSADYQSFYGGTYITSRGTFPFLEVTDPEEPNFRTLVGVEDEAGTYLHDTQSSVSQISVSMSNSKDKIYITDIDGQVRANNQGIRFHYWGNPNYAAHPGPKVYDLHMRGSTVYTYDSDDNEVEVGSFAGNTITLTGTPGDNSLMAIDFAELVDPAPYLTDSADFKLPQEDPEYNETTYKEEVAAQIRGTMDWIINLESDTYAVIAQKSPTETQTHVTITHIGYDKYLYDLSLNAYVNEHMVEGRGFPYPTVDDTGNPEGLFFLWNEDPFHGESGIYKSQGDSIPPENVTDKYRTRYIRIHGAGWLRNADGDRIEDNDGNNPELQRVLDYDLIASLQYITAVGNLVEATEDGQIKPRLNPRYNTITFRLEEEIYPGELTPGGEFHGSLDPAGRDSFGAKIYFPEVLPDNALSFAQIDVIRTFDNEVGDHGFYEGYRIVDPFATSSPNIRTLRLAGQRFITKINNDLRARGILGGASVPDYEDIVREGWTEASHSDYDPVRVFMEPTGIESLKENIYALRSQAHKMSTFISAKKISEAEKNDLESVVVVGRLTGTAQYVNEFLRRDPTTGRKYWTSLIGAIGTKLCAIIQRRMGGWAPMFTDTGGVGGQLAISVERARFEFNAEESRILDERGLNPVILDPSYGLMIISQKTTQDPDNLSDWSYLGHSMAFDLFKREVRDNVMIPQIGKPNDPYYQSMRQQQTDAILGRRTGGGAPIWAGGRIEVANVNTDEIRAQRKFKIRATVKVNVFSEYVELVFVNVGQTVSL